MAFSREQAITQARRQLEAGAEVARRAAASCGPDIADAAELLIETFRQGGRLLLCGNGGSAADCQHLATEFSSALNHGRPRPALGAIALTTDTSFLTAHANNYGFEEVFERQVEAHGRPGDVLLAISTSGNSKNVVRALGRARALGLRTVLLTGESGGQAAAAADIIVRVPSADTQRIQEVHVAAGHALCGLVENAIFPPGG
jgi:D-sedoheptulose 7-phosphate isomerase